MVDYIYRNVTSRLLSELEEIEAVNGSYKVFTLSNIEHSEFKIEIIDSIRDNLPYGKFIKMFDMGNCLIQVNDCKYYLIGFEVTYEPNYDDFNNNDELVDVTFHIKKFDNMNLAIGDFI